MELAVLVSFGGSTLEWFDGQIPGRTPYYNMGFDPDVVECLDSSELLIVDCDLCRLLCTLWHELVTAQHCLHMSRMVGQMATSQSHTVMTPAMLYTPYTMKCNSNRPSTPLFEASPISKTTLFTMGTMFRLKYIQL
jgi:hypothetical protein